MSRGGRVRCAGGILRRGRRSGQSHRCNDGIRKGRQDERRPDIGGGGDRLRDDDCRRRRFLVESDRREIGVWRDHQVERRRELRGDVGPSAGRTERRDDSQSGRGALLPDNRTVGRHRPVLAGIHSLQ